MDVLDRVREFGADTEVTDAQLQAARQRLSADLMADASRRRRRA